MRVLVVEDEAGLANALRIGLSREGYAVDAAGTCREAIDKLALTPYDLVLLDVSLPDGDGFDLAQRIRNGEGGSGSPRDLRILMLTARGALADRVQGLDAGADDYLVKPFYFGELLARLRALTRRGPASRSNVIHVGDLRIDPAAHTVTRDGERIELTQREFAVMEMLATNAGRVVSRAALLEQVWNDNYSGSTNVVDVYVGYLRKKLDHPFDRPMIRTVRGVGFRLVAA